MRPNVIILLPPPLDQYLGLQQCIEDLPVQQLISKLSVEALDVAVLSGAARLDEQRPDDHREPFQ